MIPQIDLGRQHEALRGELLAAAARVLDSTRFVLGPEVRALEAELAAVAGAAHGIGVNSGTDALLIALKAVGVRPGDEVITSAFSFVASATTVVLRNMCSSTSMLRGKPFSMASRARRRSPTPGLPT